jgi:hypothetical protein
LLGARHTSFFIRAASAMSRGVGARAFCSLQPARAAGRSTDQVRRGPCRD